MMNNKGVWYCGNILVAAFLCSNFTFLSAAGAPISLSGLHDNNKEHKPPSTFPDKSFNKELQINNRTVRCSGDVQGSHYRFPMYTCHEISVNGEKLYHGYATDGSRNNEGCSSGCPCGNVEGPPNDIQALCSAMLVAQGVNETLTAAYVVKPSCAPGEKLAKRVKLYFEQNKLVWDDVLAPNGYINTLQCLTKSHRPTT